MNRAPDPLIEYCLLVRDSVLDRDSRLEHVLGQVKSGAEAVRDAFRFAISLPPFTTSYNANLKSSADPASPLASMTMAEVINYTFAEIVTLILDGMEQQ